jgi:hypothetical protein
MGIASYSGASSVIKPGVVTSSTRPSSPFVGQLIYETDTARLAAYNGSAWVTQNSLQLIKTQTIGSAVSSVTVSDAFSASYDNYLITLSGSIASASVYMKMTLGATTTGYYNSLGYLSYDSATPNGNNNSNGAAFTFIGRITTTGCNMRINLTDPFLAVRTGLDFSYSAYDTDSIAAQGGGYLNNTTSYTGFTLAQSASATFTGGTIRVYGYANS